MYFDHFGCYVEKIHFDIIFLFMTKTSILRSNFPQKHLEQKFKKTSIIPL